MPAGTTPQSSSLPDPSRWSLHPSHREPMRRVLWLLLALAVLQLVVWLIPSTPGSKGVPQYLFWHGLMETVSIVIAMMVFAVGWNSHGGRTPGNLAILACLFFIIGTLDFSHTMSYVGMPDFLTPNGPDKHLNFWMLARLLAALTLLVVALRSWDDRISKEDRVVLFSSLLLGTLGFNLLVIYAQDAMPDLFIPGQGLTVLKKGLEYVCIAINAVTAAVLWHKMRREQTFNMPLLFAAVGVMAMSELYFTLYTTMTGAYNVLGHVYKVLSYLLIYRAVVVEAIELPYVQLAQAQNELQLAVKASNTGLWDWHIDTGKVEFSPVWKSQLGYAEDELADELATWENLLHPDDREAAVARAMAFLNAPEETIYQSEFRMRHKDGRYHWILSRGEKQRDARGNTVRLLGSHTDVTERRRAEDRFRSAVEAAPNAMIMADERGYIVLTNSLTEKIFGYAPGALLGRSISELIPKSVRAAHEGLVHSFMQTPSERSMGAGRELYAQHCDGHAFRVEVGLTPIGGRDARYVMASVVDITSRIQSEERINQLIHFDALTGLPNRQLLNDRVSQAIHAASAAGNRLAVLFMDIDHFKHVNDTLGHQVGDKLLVEVGRRLKESLREDDTVARIGGDEFVIVLTEGGGEEEAVALMAKKLISVISHPYRIDSHELVVTPSIGVAIYPDDGVNFDSLYQHADTAMYRAKQDGRNDFRFFTQDMQSRTARVLKLESAMHHALERGEFHLVYQPQLSMDGRRVIGVEALLRWKQPALGMVSPAEFIPLAESNGQIIPIGAWVLRTAVRQLRAWIDAGLPPMMMAVNVSAVQFRHINLPELVSEILNEEEVPPEYLELELTEGVAMGNPMAAVAVMDNLHGRGVRMSIDDFGTGYSSLSYLKKFNVYKLKIDQSFVRDIATDEDDRAIVAAIIRMAHSLGFKTIAEGVETEAQRAFLAQQGCDEAQGYLFGKPMSAEDIRRLCLSLSPNAADDVLL